MKLSQFLLATSAAVMVARSAMASDLRDAASDMFEPLSSTIPALADNVVTPEIRWTLAKRFF